MTGEAALVVFFWILLLVGVLAFARGYRSWARSIDESLIRADRMSTALISETQILQTDRIEEWFTVVHKNERPVKDHSSSILLVGIDVTGRIMKVVDPEKQELFSVETRLVRAYRYPMHYFVLVAIDAASFSSSLKGSNHRASLVVRLKDLNRLRELLGHCPVSKRGFYGSSQLLDP